MTYNGLTQALAKQTKVSEDEISPCYVEGNHEVFLRDFKRLPDELETA